MDKSISYYDNKSEEFINNTINCNMENVYDYFFKFINKGIILDLGFGSGRDSKYFLSKGFNVYSLDPSSKMCENGVKIGLPNIIDKSILDYKESNKFDAIWACASLLHIDEDNLSEAFFNCYNLLKNGGIMYASFKYGDFIGIRNDRYYIDLTEKSILKYLPKDLKLIDYIVTLDVRGNDTKWLNVILSKK